MLSAEADHSGVDAVLLVCSVLRQIIVEYERAGQEIAASSQPRGASRKYDTGDCKRTYPT